MPAVPLAGISLSPPSTDEPYLLRVFTQELAISCCSDDQGVRHPVPEGSEFTIHRAADDTGKPMFVAVYDGPAGTKDEWLAGQPEWRDEMVQERLALLQAAA